jgi:hypothetical protein
MRAAYREKVRGDKGPGSGYGRQADSTLSRDLGGGAQPDLEHLQEAAHLRQDPGRHLLYKLGRYRSRRARVTPPRGTFPITFLLSQECAEALNDARQHLAGGPLARSGEDHTQPGQKPVPVRSREQKLLLAPEVVVDEPLGHPGCLRDVLRSGVLEALLREQAQLRVDQLFRALLGLPLALGRRLHNFVDWLLIQFTQVRGIRASLSS